MELDGAARRLARDDKVEDFDCGEAALNDYLHRFAWQNQQAHAATSYVVTRESRVVGYYSLAVGSVTPEEATARTRQGMARHPVPVMILARLAVDRSCQGQGLGRALLKDALLRTRQAADIAGIRCLVVHAKGDSARGWYEQFDFEPSPTDPYHLFLLMKDIDAALRG